MIGERGANSDPSATLPASEGLVWTYDLVQERLIEAAVLWRRAPDKTAHWHAVRAYWPDMRRHNHFGDYGDTEASPRPLPLSKAELARMEEASGWISAHVPERDRKLVCMALAYEAAGKRPAWRAMLGVLGLPFGAQGLANRYSRAITAVVKALDKGGVPVRMAMI